MTLMVLSGNAPCCATAGAAQSANGHRCGGDQTMKHQMAPYFTNEPPTVFVDMNADDLVERAFGNEAQRGRALGLEAVRPAGDDAHDQFVRLAADARRDLVAGDPAQRLDLLGDGAAHAGHGQVDARLDLVARQPRGVNEEADRRARAGVGVHHRVGDRQLRLLAVERLADDAGEEARRGLVRLARPHHDRRQPDADAFEDALAACSRRASARTSPSARRRRSAASGGIRRGWCAGTARRTPRSTR